MTTSRPTKRIDSFYDMSAYTKWPYRHHIAIRRSKCHIHVVADGSLFQTMEGLTALPQTSVLYWEASYLAAGIGGKAEGRGKEKRKKRREGEWGKSSVLGLFSRNPRLDTGYKHYKESRNFKSGPVHAFRIIHTIRIPIISYVHCH